MDPRPAGDAHGDDSDDDLDLDLATSALHTGTTAFEAGDWEEANALLQEALQLVQQLPPHQRAFCDQFALRYQLTLCSYYVQEPAEAAQILSSFAEQEASSPAQRQCVCDAAHYLALLYVRLGRIDDAKAACEKALQGRRRLLGKQSEPALLSTALIAHIYGLAGSRARATACLAIIPEARRDEAVSAVEASLGAMSKHSKHAPAPHDSVLQTSDPRRRSRPSTSEWIDPSSRMEDRCVGPVSLDISAPRPLASPRPSYQRYDSRASGRESPGSVGGDFAYKYHSPDLKSDEIASVETLEPPRAEPTSGSTRLSRTDILRNLRCVPSDRIEEAVCAGDAAAVSALLLKKKSSSWRFKMQKALHSKRVTALHYAALFGELAIARDLLSAGYNIDEIPEASTTRQTPLKFALGARQAEMVTFLTERGARPLAPDTWASLAGLLLDRSWLANTLSTADRQDAEHVPGRIIAILRTWLKKGWDPNSPTNAAGRTLLHQAVAFESGFYKWDASLRGTITRFLCNEGADPMRADTKGNTPYDMATVVEDQDVLLVFDQRLRMRELDQSLEGLRIAELGDNRLSRPVELSAEMPTHVVELPAPWQGAGRKGP
ncbi:hypothetical protein LTR53_015930 [Teratosphaeriaceae sp. CCFEE 6253]|nr:hypothetical protein LTR53_015930 [Teratosphaeriaceae sp. CCFEE 6253]